MDHAMFTVYIMQYVCKQCYLYTINIFANIFYWLLFLYFIIIFIN